jgi:hypothetical protein
MLGVNNDVSIFGINSTLNIEYLSSFIDDELSLKLNNCHHLDVIPEVALRLVDLPLLWISRA